MFLEGLRCFTDADQLILGEIYPAGEAEIPGISGQSLAAAMQHPAVAFVPDLNDCVADVARNARAGDIVVTLGAGSVGLLGQKIIEQLKSYDSTSAPTTTAAANA